VSLRAQDDNEFALLRRHLEQVVAHGGAIRSQLAGEALQTYRLYRAEAQDTEAYPDVASEADVWPLITPTTWHFELGNAGFKSRVIIDFGWPNPHALVAYLADTALYLLDVQG
jgi:hypothetical protein